jgi:hypothetical protein
MSVVRGGLYGWKGRDLAGAAKQVAEALSIELELRDSSFRGGDYYNWDGPLGEELIVQRNFRDAEGELEYPEFPEHQVLLQASAFEEAVLDVIGDLSGLDKLESYTYEVPES